MEFQLENIDVCACKDDGRYLVYSNGMLYDSKTDKFKRWTGNGVRSKYLAYNFRKDGQWDRKVYVHRLVADHFIPNPNNYDCVHHKDSNVTNNDVSNLEWVTHTQNCRYKLPQNPWKYIKKNEKAYIWFSGNYYTFTYVGSATTGGYKGVLPVKKYFKSLSEAQEFRDDYFTVA